MLRRLLGLGLLALGWVFLRRRMGASGSGSGTQTGSAMQVLTEGRTVLADRATELTGTAREVVSNVVRSTRESAAEKAGRLRSADQSGSSGGSVGIPTTAQLEDDASLVQDVAPVSATPSSVVDAPTYAVGATGPDVPFTDPMPGEVAGDPDLTTSGQADDTTATSQMGTRSTHNTTAEQPVTSDYITFTSDDDPASTVTQEPSATTRHETSSDAVDTSMGASEMSFGAAQPDMDASSADATSAEDTDGEPEGLLIAPDAGPAPTSATGTTSVQEAETYQSSVNDVDVQGSTAEDEVSSADDGGTQHDRRPIEGGSGDRIYTSDEPRGAHDTQDTAETVGRPGPVADARREELQSLDITPESGASTADYQTVEVSLPPETLAAMESMDEHGHAQTVDYPIEEGYSVESTDGKVGSVSSVVRVEGAAENYMVVKEGLILKKEVNIPFSAVDRVEGDTVYLTIDKQYIKLMEGQETIHTGDAGPQI